MARHLLTYLGTFLAVGVLDALWLGVIARSWYAQGLGHLMSERPFWPAAAGFYLLYPVGLLVFAVLPSGGDLARALALGAAAGLFAYGTYDLTNAATLRRWPANLVVIDLMCGVVLTALAATAGFVAGRAVGVG